MGIRNKRPGPMPIYPERWQELAKDGKRLNEAAKEYWFSHRGLSLFEAMRHVREFHQKHVAKFS